MTRSGVAVFGAGGPVGRAILDVLRADPRLSVVACLRRPPANDPGVPWRLADARDERAVARALDGCGYAVNAVGGAPATLVGATETLCRAARSARLRRLVHVSSMAVYAARPGLASEDWPLEAAPAPYAAAKIASEAAVRAHAAAGESAVSLRAGVVFGPHSSQWSVRIARLLLAGRLGDLGAAGDGFCNLTHEADLGAAVSAALLAGELPPALNVSSPDPPTWNVFFEAFARALRAVPLRRIGARRLTVETRLLAPVLRAARIASARAGAMWPVPDAIPPSLARLFALRLRLESGLADEVLAIRRTPDLVAITDQAARMAA